MSASLGSQLTGFVGNSDFFTAVPNFLPVVSQSEPTVILAPQDTATIDATFSQIIFRHFTGSSIMPFLDPTGVRLSMLAAGYAPTTFGGGSQTATFDATITYHVPDAGSTLGLFCLALGIITAPIVYLRKRSP
jgi:hypothetical protein